MALKNLLIVGLGGFVGSVLRYSVSGWVQRLAPEGSFPLGTLAVNVTGCLVLGFLGGLAENLEVFAPGTRVFVFLGVLGGFTTFSSFGYETAAMLRDGQMLGGLANIGLQVLLGLGAVMAGYGLSTLE
ncbi:MAG TPA: fluoride efflux transporter CrcB [bacterium]|nr:fluoride efflux transporter CrcB [bacterium]HPJ72247.1 fluoride efflux transporter CrcB [bacterium]